MRNKEWARLLAYVTGLVNQELLFQNEYLAAENGILRAQLPTRLRRTNAQRHTLAEIGKRLGRKALGHARHNKRHDYEHGCQSEQMARLPDPKIQPHSEVIESPKAGHVLKNPGIRQYLKKHHGVLLDKIQAVISAVEGDSAIAPSPIPAT